MSAETLLTAGMVAWTFVTLLIYLRYRLDIQGQRQAWKRIALERRRLGAARRILDEMALEQRFPDTKSELDHCLNDESLQDAYSDDDW
jgi:hypothetical protein